MLKNSIFFQFQNFHIFMVIQHFPSNNNEKIKNIIIILGVISFKITLPLCDTHVLFLEVILFSE